MTLYTIGFTQKSAARFFSLLRENNIKRVIDIRLNFGGQPSGFAKGSDLAWFLRQLNGCGYIHLPQLAPTTDIFTGYRTGHIWNRYLRLFEDLMDERGIPHNLARASFATAQPSCLLCSEATPERCHPPPHR